MSRMWAAAGGLAVLGGMVGAALHALNAAAGRALPPSYWLLQLGIAVGYGLLAVAVRDRGTVLLRATVAGIALLAGSCLVAYEWGVWEPAATWAVWYGAWAWAPAYTAIVVLLPQLLPDGRPASPTLRPVLWLGVGTVAAAAVMWALLPYADQDVAMRGQNPVGVQAAGSPAVVGVVQGLLAIGAVAAAATVVLRWRRSAAVERRQLSWVLLGVLATLALAVLARLLAQPLGELVAGLAMLPLPAAVAVAVLRHGLWDLEVVLSRTAVVVTVSAVAVGAYVGAVWLLGQVPGGRPGEVSLVVVALLAPLLLPLHHLLQRRVNRWVHGAEHEPGRQLLLAADRLSAAADPAEMVARVLPDSLAALRRALHADGVRLVLDDGTTLVDGQVPARPSATADLAHAGSVLGRVEAARPDGLDGRDRARLADWAVQASVAVHTLLLTRAVQRSRELVTVLREEERRRLRRDLHDGVGPSLAALALQLETARDVAASDPAAAARLLETLAPRLNAVVGDVRALVHELRPPTLDELGLAGATRELAARLAGPALVEVDTDGLAGHQPTDTGAAADLPAAVEVAAYRIAGEALTNAVRHAGAARVRLTLRRSGTSLVVEVADDGTGVADGAVGGVGLGSMRERAEELGGWLELVTGPRGTTVRAWLPGSTPEPVDARPVVVP